MEWLSTIVLLVSDSHCRVGKSWDCGDVLKQGDRNQRCVEWLSKIVLLVSDGDS
ncbi:MAG: hypothetical protein SAK29_34865 [Scytonema sp. PMC 1069.18]|nr:hypothetical protein [Scytonema sp. PMC 1069.18]